MKVYTDMSRYTAVTDGDYWGVATKASDEEFDIVKGTKVALLRLFTTPQISRPDFEEVPYEIHAEFSFYILTKLACNIARWAGFCVAEGCDFGFWRVLEEESTRLHIHLSVDSA